MRFKEYLAEQLSKTELFEMAFSKKKAESIIDDLATPIFQHLIKVLYYEDTQNYKKHISDINQWLYKIDSITVKTKTKRLSYKNYHDWLYVEPYEGLDSLERTINKYMKTYHKLPVLSTIEELDVKIKFIYDELSKQLESDTFENIESILNQL